MDVAAGVGDEAPGTTGSCRRLAEFVGVDDDEDDDEEGTGLVLNPDLFDNGADDWS